MSDQQVEPVEFNYSAEKGLAVGLEGIASALEKVRTGAFLRLDSGASAYIMFRGPKDFISWVAHRAPEFYEGSGEPVIMENGQQSKKLVACGSVYGRECQYCNNGGEEAKLHSRTAAVVYLMKEVSTAGVVANRKSYIPIDVLILEGGPRIWKSQILPLVQEHGLEKIYKITRRGERLKTTYEFIVLNSDSGAARKRTLELGNVNMMDAINLGVSEE